MDPTQADVLLSSELFAASFLKILDKDKKLTPFVYNRAQRDFNSRRTGRDLILKARQLGFTTYVQGEIFRRNVTRTSNSITLTHLADATTKIRLMVDRFYDNCRFGNAHPARKYANSILTTYPELDSTAAIATAGSLNTGRGDTFTDFHGSEVAFWPDARSIISGAMQGGNPDVVLESTPNGAQGYFYELCMEAFYAKPEDRNTWKLHFYPWWWDDTYRMELDEGEELAYNDEEKELVARHRLSLQQIKWRRNKQRELGRLFPQEYPEDPVACFLTSGTGYFGDIAEVFTAPEGVTYNPTHRYCGGLDFAQTTDFTALPVLDFTTKTQVDLLHIHNLSWAEQRSRIRQTCQKWHIETLLAEKNSIGSPNIEELRRLGINIQAFVTTNESKADIMSGLNEAIHYGGWRLLPLPVQKNEFNTFIATQLTSGVWRLAAAGEGHDDTVIGMGLALASGRYAVSEEDMANYGAGIVLEGDLDDDMIEYHSQTYNLTFEQAREHMLEQIRRTKKENEMMEQGLNL